MAKKIVLEVEVRGDEVSLLKQNLNQAADNFDEVGDSGQKAADRYSGAIKKSNPIVEKLNQATGGLLNTVLDLGDGVKKANLSFKGMRTALIATGIGAFVVALGLVVAYWDEINDWVNQVNKKLERQAVLYENISKEIDHQLRLNKLDQEIAKKKGESLDALLAKEKEILEAKLKNTEDAIINLQTQLQIEESKKREFTLMEKGLTALKAYVFGYQTVGQSVVQGLGFDFLSELKGKLNELKESAKETQSALLGDGVEGAEKTAGGRDKVSAVGFGGEDKGDANQAELDTLIAHIDAMDAAKQEQHDKDLSRIEQERLARMKAHEANKKEDEDELRRKEILTQQTLTMASDTFGSLGSILGESSAAGKAVGIAQALINTYQGISAGVKLGYPAAIPAVAAAAATGFKAVKQISSTKLPKIAGVSGGGSGGGGAAPAVPQANFNVVGSSGINQVGDVLGEQLKKPQKSYVVFGDIKSAEQLDRESVRSATV